jgi:peptidoglycan-associated lipoprotein
MGKMILQKFNKRKIMKTTKLFYTLAFVLAVTLAATGCKTHKPGYITPLPGQNPPPVVDQGNNPPTLPPGNQFNSNENPQANNVPTNIPTENLLEFEGMIEDTNALVAYTIHFAYDSSVIRKNEKSNLQAVATALGADANLKLLIEGNCDERGTEEYNRALGERRALSAREALAKLGVDPARVRTISYGEDRPVDSGHDESAWQKNRRDDFVLLHPKM